jgi:murein DD-endopeptidase MepM/ murein hydrolase activator NlpD
MVYLAQNNMQKTLQVFLPYDKSTITQRFGENANPLYAGAGLKGHTAYDWGVPYGTAIPNCTPNAYCYSRMNEGDTNYMDYKAVFFIVETETGIYEVSYGHLSGFVAEVGKTYQVGDTIGYVGNSGPVYVGQHEVTEAEKEAGSHAGAHLHGPQIRLLAKMQYTSGIGSYPDVISDANGPIRWNGYYLGVPNYSNGYNGCISLAQFSTETLATQGVTVQPITPPTQDHPLTPVEQNLTLQVSLLSTVVSLLKRLLGLKS